MARACIGCGTTAWDSTCVSPTSSSASSNGSTAPRTMRARALDWRSCSASCCVMAVASGPNRRRTRERHSFSRWEANPRMNSDDQVEILLVEDNPNDLELALHALKRNNLANHIHVARDGAEALD